MVRPLGRTTADTVRTTIFPFDTHPALGFGKRWCCKKIEHEIPDTTLTDKIRWKTERGFELDPNHTVPAFPVEVMLPDSVVLGNGFFYLLTLKARKGMTFSRVHLEKFGSQHFKVQVFQEETKNFSNPTGDQEEVLKSFYPQAAGTFKFDFYYYDSLIWSEKVVVH